MPEPRQPAWQPSGANMAIEHKHEVHVQPPAARFNNRTYTRPSESKNERPLSTAINAKLKDMGIKKRSKLYLFGKQYLQRNPSFVVAPDMSKKFYTIKPQDVTVPKPHLREYDEELKKMELDAHNKQYKKHENIPLLSTFDEEQSLDQLSISEGPATNEWNKLSLPVKSEPWQSPNLSHRLSFSSKVFSPALPSQGPPATFSDVPNQQQSISGQILYTPSERNRNSLLATASNTPSTPKPSRNPRLSAEEKDLFTPIARSDPSSPITPTALPSNYRPESWRRSVLLARDNSQISHDSISSNGTGDEKEEEVEEEDSSDDVSIDEALDFVGTFGTFLKKAIADRAERTLSRKSWAAENNLELGLEYSNSSSNSLLSDTPIFLTKPPGSEQPMDLFSSSGWSGSESQESLATVKRHTVPQSVRDRRNEDFVFSNEPNLSPLEMKTDFPSPVSSKYSFERHTMPPQHTNQSEQSLESPRDLLEKKKSKHANSPYSESSEVLTHARQTTMASMWGPEDESEQGSVFDEEL